MAYRFFSVPRKNIWMLLAAALVVGGCGSSSTETGLNPNSNNNTGTKTVNAFFSKAPVQDGQCSLYSAEGKRLAGPTSTNAGVASFSITSTSGSVYVDCEGGTYVDEATGQAKQAPNLRGVTTLQSATEPQVVITPLAELAFRRASADGVLKLEGYNEALAQVAKTFGMANQNLAAVKPTDVNTTKAADNAAGEYGAVLAAISQMQKNSNSDLNTLIKKLDDGMGDSGFVNGVVKADFRKAVDDVKVSSLVSANLPPIFVAPPVTDPVITISSVSPTSTPEGTEKLFTITGSNLYIGLSVRLMKGTALAASCPIQSIDSSKTTMTALCPSQNAQDLSLVVIDGYTTLKTATVNITAIAKYTIGGTIEGLTDAGLILKNATNNETLTIAASATSFTLPTKLPTGATYNILINQHPTGQTCTISNASGTVRTVNINDIKVSCSLAALTIRQVDVMQVYSQPINAPSNPNYQILVPGREAIVRAYVYANSSSDASNAVVKMTINSESTNTTMSCPAPLSTTLPTATPIHDYDLSKTCYATIPASKVASGLSVKVSAGSASVTSSPVINNKSAITIVAVPVKIITANNATGFTANLPTSEAIINVVKKKFPFASVTVEVAPVWLAPDYRGQKLSENLYNTSINEWEHVLSELRLKQLDEGNTHKFYFGFIPTNPNTLPPRASITLGVAYISSTTGIGVDTGIGTQGGGWDTTFIHELGHNLSLLHAPCGGAANTDSFWDTNPWTGASTGKLSPVGIYNGSAMINPADTGLSSTKGIDIMGYCTGEWLSDYNFHKAANYIKTISAASYVAANNLEANTSPSSVLTFSGHINSEDEVTMSPVMNSQYLPVSTNSGPYSIKLYTQTGTVIEHRFKTSQIEDARGFAPSSHFIFTLANPGPLSRIEFIKDGKILTQNTSQLPKAAQDNMLRNAAGEEVQPTITESQGALSIKWDSVRYPLLKVVFISANGQRQVIVSQARGGLFNMTRAELIEQRVTEGGKWELSLSDGINTQLIIKTR